MSDFPTSIATKQPILNRLFMLPLFLSLEMPATAQTLSADEAARLATERPDAAQLLEAPIERAEGNLQTARTLPNPVASIDGSASRLRNCRVRSHRRPAVGASGRTSNHYLET